MHQLPQWPKGVWFLLLYFSLGHQYLSLLQMLRAGHCIYGSCGQLCKVLVNHRGEVVFCLFLCLIGNEHEHSNFSSNPLPFPMSVWLFSRRGHFYSSCTLQKWPVRRSPWRHVLSVLTEVKTSCLPWWRIMWPTTNTFEWLSMMLSWCNSIISVSSQVLLVPRHTFCAFQSTTQDNELKCWVTTSVKSGSHGKLSCWDLWSSSCLERVHEPIVFFYTILIWALRNLYFKLYWLHLRFPVNSIWR